MKIKNWATHQHYSQRRPPWIKFKHETLDDYEINKLTDFEYRCLTRLWLVASEDPKMQGFLPADESVCFRLRITREELKKVLAVLETGGFIVPDDAPMVIHDNLYGHQNPVSEVVAAQIPNEVFIQELREKKEYKGIDIDTESMKMDVWLSSPRNKYARKKTKKFMTSWLDRMLKKEDVIGPSDTKNPEGKTSEELRMTALAEGWEGI